MQDPWILLLLNLILILILILIFFCLTTLRRKRRKANSLGKTPYRKQEHFLSAAEHRFYFALRLAVSARVEICPKPSVRELLCVSEKAGKDSQMYFNWISQKHVDFALCDPKSMDVLCAVELDDASHQRKDRLQRDAFLDKAFQTAGLPLFHVKCKVTYSEADFSEIVDLLDPPPAATAPLLCPNCKSPMVLRVAKKGAYMGQEFYGCSNYPHCKTTLRK